MRVDVHSKTGDSRGKDKGTMMDHMTQDQSVLQHIQQLASEEHRLFAQGALSQSERERLHTIQVALDQCWDLLRQRRALRDAGKDPNEARVRPPEVVENYKQ